MPITGVLVPGGVSVPTQGESPSGDAPGVSLECLVCRQSGDLLCLTLIGDWREGIGEAEFLDFTRGKPIPEKHSANLEGAPGLIASTH